MTEIFQLPAASVEVHLAIGQKAAGILGGWVDGNGLKAAQVRLVRHDTQIHQLPGAIIAGLKPEMATSQVKGRAPRGQVLASQAEVHSHTDGLIQALLDGQDVQREILQALGQTPQQGFGMEPLALILHATKKEFSVIDMCLKCNGATFLPCTLCNATGATPCVTCSGQGFTPCQICFGTGRTQDHHGAYLPCLRCQGIGKIQCHFCQGHKQLVCTICQGQGKTGCTECGLSGFLTHVYQIVYKAECLFELDRQQIPPEVLKIIDVLGIRQLASEGHAEIFWLPPEVREKHIFIPFIACLPVAAAEFSIEGKSYPALVAGLQGRIVQIDPLLDAIVKPGITALMKLSKGPLAAQALIDTACKYKLIRQVMNSLTRYSKKTAYQKLVREYPVILSDKYARAAVRYADMALHSIGSGPRYKGLLAGTVLGGLLAAGYYMTHFRAVVLAAMQQRNLGQDIIVPDMAVWLLGFAAAVFVIKFMAASAFRKLLPETITTGKAGLPAAGMQGVWAFLTTFVVWLAVAAFAAEKPEWLAFVFKL